MYKKNKVFYGKEPNITEYFKERGHVLRAEINTKRSILGEETKYHWKFFRAGSNFTGGNVQKKSILGEETNYYGTFQGGAVAFYAQKCKKNEYFRGRNQKNTE